MTSKVDQFLRIFVFKTQTSSGPNSTPGLQELFRVGGPAILRCWHAWPSEPLLSITNYNFDWNLRADISPFENLILPKDEVKVSFNGLTWHPRKGKATSPKKFQRDTSWISILCKTVMQMPKYKQISGPKRWQALFWKRTLHVFRALVLHILLHGKNGFGLMIRVAPCWIMFF